MVILDVISFFLIQWIQFIFILLKVFLMIVNLARFQVRVHHQVQAVRHRQALRQALRLRQVQVHRQAHVLKYV